MNLVLRPLQEQEEEETYQMFQEIPAEENGFENPAHGLNRQQFADFCIRKCQASQGINLKPGYVPATCFLLFADKKPVGFAKLRHYLTDALLKHGGHIGYSIRPDSRGKKYGNQILAKTLAQAQQHDISKVLLTIRDYNQASRKVCENNGGQLEKIVPGSEFAECYYWIDLNKDNK